MNREQAEERLQQVVCGDLSSASPEWTAAVQQFPELAARLAALQALQNDLDWSTLDAAALAQAATPRLAAGDRDLVRAARPTPRRPRWLWPLLVAAVLFGVIVQRTWPDAPRANGMLGSAGAVHVQRSTHGITIDGLAELPPGGRYRVELELSGSIRMTGEFATRPIELPTEWRQAIDSAGSARLLIRHPDGEAVRIDVPR